MPNNEFDPVDNAELEDDAWYSDDPAEEKKASLQDKAKSFIPVIVLIVAAVIYLPTTVGGKINISSNQAVTFGQGSNVTVACSDSTDLTITPGTSFTNVNNGPGEYYLKSIRVSNIPASCNGVDFVLSAYNDSSSSALGLSTLSPSEIRVHNKNGTFVLDPFSRDTVTSLSLIHI